MNNTIDLSKPVYDVVQEHPELMDLLVELGFAPLANKVMLTTVGKKTSILMGAKMINKPIEEIIKFLEWNGYEVIGG